MEPDKALALSSLKDKVYKLFYQDDRTIRIKHQVHLPGYVGTH